MKLSKIGALPKTVCSFHLAAVLKSSCILELKPHLPPDTTRRLFQMARAAVC